MTVWSELPPEEQARLLTRAAEVHVQNEDWVAMMQVVDRIYGRQPWMVVHHPIDELEAVPRTLTTDEARTYHAAYAEARARALFPTPPLPKAMTPDETARFKRFLEETGKVLADIRREGWGARVDELRKSLAKDVQVEPRKPPHEPHYMV